jgi:DNA topoisomerase-6 subunit B
MPQGKTLAEELASKQREISVAEFFERNRQVLGFDNPLRAVLTTVKEAVDNSIDACEEARVMPEVVVEVSRVGEERIKVAVEDNGPGILRREIPNVFGRLLYGSRFHANRQARGQQGMGISAAVLYAGLTTATPAHIISKVKEATTAVEMDLIIDTSKNMPKVLKEDACVWQRPQGTRIELLLKGRYQRGRASPYEYLKGTAIVNPHVRIVLAEPDGTRTTWEAATSEMPPLSKEIPPHPHGMELGELLQRLKNSKRGTVKEFLVGELSGIFPRTADEVLSASGRSGKERPGSLSPEDVERLHTALRSAHVAPPPTDCLSPIGPVLIKRGLKNVLGDVRPEFYASPISRPPKVFAGCPFVVEVGLVYGGGLPAEEPIQLLRFANRVPLLFQQGACAITSAVCRVDWRRYGLEQKGGALPVGPVLLLVHVASTKIPFTSEAKEAIAEVEEIDKEIILAVQAVARSLSLHISRHTRRAMASEKFTVVRKILPRLAEKTSALVNQPIPDLTPVITKIMNVVAVESVGDEEKGTSSLVLTNYTERPRDLKLFMELPQEALGDGFGAEPSAEQIDNNLGRVSWKTIHLSPSERYDLKFRWPKGIDVDLTDSDIYVAGVDEAHLLGADPLPGDWDVRLPKELVEEAKTVDKEVEGEEVDYDAAERKEGVKDED